MKRFPFSLHIIIPAFLFVPGILLGLPFLPLGAILLCLSITLYIYLNTKKNIDLLIDATNLLAKGRLDFRVKLNGSGEFARLADAFNKMADMVRAETEELRKSHERFDLAVRGANDGIWDRDLITNEVYYSPRWKSTLGYEDHEIPNLYEEWVKRIHPEDLERVLETGRAHREGHTPYYICEYRMMHKDGNYRWIRARGLAIRNAAGRPYRMAGSHTDITEGKKAEEENLILQFRMLQAQKLESLGVLAGGIAHDFNNMLMSIMGNTEMALRKLPDRSPAREQIEQVAKVTKRSAELVKQLLAYAGKGRFVVEPIDLSALVEEMADLLRVSIGKNITMRYELIRNSANVEADAAQLRQVAMNLIINASDAIGKNPGVITVATGVTECDRRDLDDAEIGKGLPEGSYVYLDVTDNGCGIDEETRKRIFDPFFTTKFTGRGLGLAAVYGILRVHNGALRISSKVGEGTTFRMLLPRSDRPLYPEQKENKKSDAWRGSGTILVIDDEEEIVNLNQMMLEGSGFSVLKSTDAAEGIDIFRRNRNNISAVLMDLTMPKMSGLEAFGKMKGIRDDVPVIFISGYSEEEIKNNLQGEGFAGFLQKPYTPDELLGKIREVLGN